MVCLDRGGHVLHLSLMHTGTVDEVALYPRLVVQMALRHDAHAVLLAHNHPSGMAEPSQADVATTNRVIAALSTIDVVLTDHLIFSRGEVYSISHKRRYADGIAGDAYSYMSKPAGGALRDELGEWIACAEIELAGERDETALWNEG